MRNPEKGWGRMKRIAGFLMVAVLVAVLSGCAITTYEDPSGVRIRNYALFRKYTAEKTAGGVRVDAGVDPMTRDILMQGIEIGKALGAAGAAGGI